VGNNVCGLMFGSILAFDGQDMWHVWGRGEVHTGL
jgi:hypothetical protein